jgi:AraC-like DNA-binding protein
VWNDRIIRVSRGVLPAGTWENVRARPHPDLAAYVREYQGYFEHSSQPLRRREMPSGDVSIIISFGNRYEMIDPRTGGSLGQRSTFVAGLDDGPALVDSTGGGMAMQIDFTPIGAHRALKVPMHLLAHGTTELSELLGTHADRLVERLFEARDWQTRFWILDEYLLPKISQSKATEIDWAWRQLENSRGLVPISLLNEKLGWSRKRLTRAFREYVGVPPKTLGRILRFRHALDELSSRRMMNASLVAAECGYSDQAHMIREFFALSGATPTELLKRYSSEGGIVEF